MLQCDALGNPTGFFHLTAGQDHDLVGADALMDEMTKADFVLADKAYDADKRMRQKLEEKGFTPIISPKSYRKNLLDYNKDTYKARHLIENFFAKLKQYRTIATHAMIKQFRTFWVLSMASIGTFHPIV